MITRGFVIGKIIDDFAILKNQISIRVKLGLTDLNKYSEDFIKEVLNITLDLSLLNLNSERSNEPGIDLGDKKSKKAFQITSTKTLKKIKSTIEKITLEQTQMYDEFYVFIIGKKQKTYAIEDKKLRNGKLFDVDNIWDIQDLLTKIITLDYDKLFSIYKLFEKEFQIVITELEIPDNEGVYPTSLLKKLEIKPHAKAKNAKKINTYLEGENIKLSLDSINDEFDKLSNIPRLTREFLYVIIKRGRLDYTNLDFYILNSTLRKLLDISKLEFLSEIEILLYDNFISISSGEIQEGIPTEVVSTKFNEILFNIIQFSKEIKQLKKVLVNLDFTILDK